MMWTCRISMVCVAFCRRDLNMQLNSNKTVFFVFCSSRICRILWTWRKKKHREKSEESTLPFRKWVILVIRCSTVSFSDFFFLSLSLYFACSIIWDCLFNLIWIFCFIQDFTSTNQYSDTLAFRRLFFLFSSCKKTKQVFIKI